MNFGSFIDTIYWSEVNKVTVVKNPSDLRSKLLILLNSFLALAIPIKVEGLDDTAFDSNLSPGINLQQITLYCHPLKVHHRGQGSDVLFSAASSVQQSDEANFKDVIMFIKSSSLFISEKHS